MNGLFIGRFQPPHWGHINLMNKALGECDRLFVGIGSTQESGTEKNPFSFSERKRMILNFYREHRHLGDRVRIFGIADIFNAAKWPSYVKDSVKAYIENEKLNASIPEVYYCGSEYDGHWMNDSGLKIKLINRNDSDPTFCGTTVRHMIMYHDRRWKNAVPEAMWQTVEELEKKYDWNGV